MSFKENEEKELVEIEKRHSRDFFFLSQQKKHKSRPGRVVKSIEAAAVFKED